MFDYNGHTYKERMSKDDIISFILKQPSNADHLCSLSTEELQRLQRQCSLGVETLQKIVAQDYEEIKPLSHLIPILKRFKENRRRLEALRKLQRLYDGIINLETGTICSVTLDDLDLETDAEDAIPREPFADLGAPPPSPVRKPNKPLVAPPTPKRSKSQTPPSRLPQWKSTSMLG